MPASTKNNAITSPGSIRTRSEAEELDPFETALIRLQAHPAITHPGMQVRPLSTVSRGNSNILRIQLQSDEENQYLLMKAYKHYQGFPRQEMVGWLKKDYTTMERLYTHWQNSSKFAIPRPIACYPDLLILVMEEWPGKDLTVVLKQEAHLFPSENTMERLEHLCYLCGEWVKAHQNSDFVKEHPATFYLATFLDYIDIRLRNLVQCPGVPLDELFRKQILQYVQRRWPDLDPSETRTVDVHGDYAPCNVMTDGAKLIIIDFTSYGRGSIYQDLSRFYHQLDMYLFKPIFRPKVIRRLQRALLDGYEPKLEVEHPLFELMLVRHTLCHLCGHVIRDGLIRDGHLEQLPRHQRWYNHMVIRKHIGWLRKTCLSIEL